MSSNAPYTHRRKWRFGCQAKKRSGAPSALKRSLTGGFFLACRIDRLIPLAALCLITCIATILNPDNGPLFMVAGDPNAAVGTTIGFVGDVIIPGHVAESVLCAIHLASALIAAVCRMPLLALFLSLLISIGPLLAYPRAYIAGSTPMVAWMSPAVRLMHTCSLNISEASLAAGAAVGAGICVVASILTYAICSCQEACR